ncbi:hypothetical protein FOL47_003009 [Perkinsus chesapeaki]|uniref:Uncharacterized protein n=1 Tax=Perkinsus chesapeaki TaxID=330153 RepID=A0A7J6N0R1_PERCH|nr:hypothetical protein FOL47_003009 [Perkinsus chesapeaki]
MRMGSIDLRPFEEGSDEKFEFIHHISIAEGEGGPDFAPQWCKVKGDVKTTYKYGDQSFVFDSKCNNNHEFGTSIYILQREFVFHVEEERTEYAFQVQLNVNQPTHDIHLWETSNLNRPRSLQIEWQVLYIAGWWIPFAMSSDFRGSRAIKEAFRCFLTAEDRLFVMNCLFLTDEVIVIPRATMDLKYPLAMDSFCMEDSAVDCMGVKGFNLTILVVHAL